MALVRLGRKAEAGATIDAALARDPGNAITHANQGWTQLERGDRKKALEHFREALRLDPTNDWARSGIVEALKAGNPVYALMLRYFLWTASLSRGAQWGLILGGYFGSRMLAVAAKSSPELRPWILPLQLLYIAFVLLTWLAQPLFNLLLRLNRFGRLALSEEQTRASNWVGTCFLAAAIAAIAAVFTGFPVWLVVLFFVAVGVSLPVSAIFGCQAGWPRRAMIGYAGVVALVGVLAVISFLGEQIVAGGVRRNSPGFSVLGLFGLGLFVNGFLGNYLRMQHPKR
jgi:hypothetical protein